MDDHVLSRSRAAQFLVVLAVAGVAILLVALEPLAILLVPVALAVGALLVRRTRPRLSNALWGVAVASLLILTVGSALYVG